MKKFRFRLQVLLDQKKRLEEIAQKNYSLSLQRLQQIEDMITSQERQIKETFRLSETVPGETFSSQKLLLDRRYVVTLQVELENFFEHKKIIEEDVSQKQFLLAEASRNRQVLSKLREKHLERWRCEILRFEQSEMDEIAGNIIRYRVGGRVR
jgi:flagellar export protein FliJ